MKQVVIIYHGDCSDGFGGAYAAWKKFWKKADYFGLKHHMPVPKIKNKEVYIVDFGVSQEKMKELLENNKKVVALDHHVSAEKTTKMADEYIYALKNSGAVIAWKYFHPNKPVPKLLQHIEDIDLWKFKLAKTREISAYLQLAGYDFQNWDQLVKKVEKIKSRLEVIEKGENILKYEKILMGRLMQSAEVVKFENYKTMAVNSPILMSEIGNAITKKMPPIGIVWSRREGKIVVSLRSNGKVNVAKIAERYGGGGHKAAAGFSLSASAKLPWKIVNK